ncbi:MAG: anhydro-N-acetylmuramic acid kinase, partial [Flavobacteriales bacterium]
TSLDGLDIACCTFTRRDKSWTFQLEHVETKSYSAEIQQSLSVAHAMTISELHQLHVQLGRMHGDWVADFIRSLSIGDIDFIASHGHTVLHQPDQGITLQIGSPSEIAARTGLSVIADFRSQDVALGGQGAPLVPAGECHLFPGYRYLLNIGGIANITRMDEDGIMAFDVCVANIALNYYSNRLGQAFDRDGVMARQGRVSESLQKALNADPYFSRLAPKSLGREYFENTMLPLLNGFALSEYDVLATCVEHLAQQVACIVGQESVFVTGGGALNSFIIERIQAHGATNLVIPQQEMVQFKEALIFAFLGVLRYLGEPNCLARITGARHDHCSGAIYLP